MSPIISIFIDVNNESPNMKIYYSCIYFRDQNRKLLEYDFCSKIYLSIYRDRVKNRALLEMLFYVQSFPNLHTFIYLFFIINLEFNRIGK